MGQIVVLTIGGPLFLQVVQLTNTFHEVRQVEKCIPKKQISPTDYQFYIYLKNGKKFELRYGKAKSEVFEGYYFRHPKYNKGIYVEIRGVDRIKSIKDFLRLNLTRTEREHQPIYRFGVKKTPLYKIKSCWKCGGVGYIQAYKHIANGRCFVCNNDGHKPEPEGWQFVRENNIKDPQLKLNLEGS